MVPSGGSLRKAAIVSAALALAAVASQLFLVACTSVDVPLLDDWDTLVGFLVYWQDEADFRGRLRQLFDPHNEHLLAVPRLALLGVHGLTGHIDFAWLNLIGNLLVLVLLGALWCEFRRDAPAAERAIGFLPAVLFTVQPQAWTTVISPTVSLSNNGVMAFGAVCFACLARSRVAWAGLAAAAATFSQGNGIFVLPIAACVPWLQGQHRLARRWGFVSLAATVVYFWAAPNDYGTASPWTSLARPDRLASYALYFVGSAGGFGRPTPSAAVGAVLVASFAWLTWRGLAQRNPALFALCVFLFASVAGNALVRAHQGADAALFQPRYRLYGGTLLALTWLGWLEVAPRLRTRTWTATAALVSILFWGASFHSGAAAAKAHANALRAGLDRWWETGAGGLRHPDFRKANFFLTRALHDGLLRIPDDWPERYGERPRASGPPPGPGAAVVWKLNAVHSAEGYLTVIGQARGSGSALGQRVEIALVRDNRAWFAPARGVARGDPPTRHPPDRRLTGAGFHALVDTRDLPAGRYRLGVLVHQGEHVYFAAGESVLTIEVEP
ncbi:MAG: hypothetical protein QF890_00340 [Myxococcota bacterium]|nr:hypothetical protein [Deltaproteobacteria bacterium]MCP4244184.1 hypothetical protein [bacterium]MDP7076180.1 hypothetical protein [Myxococcota bacterium]MDP7298766.1 hypothetical protein [Myxococcota bacterium]MDP7431004.1 hypothetical protein [Myxococcota bacterium]